MYLTMTTDYKEKYFNSKFKNIEDGFKRISDEIKANTKLTEEVKEHAEETNGRVTTLEKEVFGKIKPADLPPMWRDPKVISIVFNISLFLLILAAAATKVDIGRLLP